MQFNKDINALRALAVTAVVLFHFSVPGMHGGFVGVDVFFVISGYLMTGVVMRRLENGSFSLRQFYADRVRRIVPALLMLCLVLLVIGWVLLLPSDYKKLGKQIAGSLGFVSNIFFWREAGYFDVVSHRKWLLHTWSLSVEWQFYMLYPLLLLALRRVLGSPKIRWALVTLALASLALSVVASSKDPSAAFYLLSMRAWQMLLGGVVFLFPVKCGPRSLLAMEAIGLALVVASVLLLDSKVTWPGWLAVIPTAGAALVISTQRQASALFDNRPTQAIGQASYSIYLWHWPVVVALMQWGEMTEWVRSFTGIGLSLTLGWLSFRFVETPARRWRRESPTSVLGVRISAPRALFGGAAVAVMLSGTWVWATDGVLRRFPASVSMADAEALNGNPFARGCFATRGAPLPPCLLGGDVKVSQVDLIGDSHALSIATALAAAVPSATGGGVRFFGYASCPTSQSATYGASENHCAEFNREAIATISRDAKTSRPLVITNVWTSYVEQARIQFGVSDGPTISTAHFTAARYRADLLATLCQLANTRRVYVTEPLPQFAVDVPRAVAYRLMRDPASPDLTIGVEEHRQRNAFVLDVMQEASKRCGVHLLDPVPFLCPAGRCMGSHNGRPLYSDEHHLSEYGNRFLIPMFRQIFDNTHASQ